jgi:phosphotransferase system enzyme I (PtsP)
MVARRARRFGKPVSVCGEMAGDPAAAILLLGMGIDALSMNASNVPRIKWLIRTIPAARARQVLRHALRLESGEAIRDLSTRALEEAGLGELVRIQRSKAVESGSGLGAGAANTASAISTGAHPRSS